MVNYSIKSKLTVTCVETQFSILETFEDGVSRLDDQGSSFKFRVEKYYELVVYTYCTFYSKNYLSVHWVRLICFGVNEAQALKAKTSLMHGLLLKVLWNSLFRSEGIHVRHIHVIAVKIEPPFESKQQRNNSYMRINITCAQCMAIIVFYFPSFVHQTLCFEHTRQVKVYMLHMVWVVDKLK